jgi:small subunit ribosomal protein S11
MRKMSEKGLLDKENHKDYVGKIEVVLRGYSEGRQAFIQALMGIEGRLIRPRVVKVSDATRIKFGGARSPNPRRLG